MTDIESNGGSARCEAEVPAEADYAPRLSGRRPVLLLAAGRGRVGATCFLDTAVQYCRAKGADLRVWDASQHSQTHGLSATHADAERPPAGTSAEDVDGWIACRVRQQQEAGYDTVLDLGASAALTRQLVRLGQVLAAGDAQRIRVVIAYLVGPERADLDVLRRGLREGWSMSHSMVILLNEGLVPRERSLRTAFRGALSDPAVREAEHRGAIVLRFPELPCMERVREQGLSFRAAADGDAAPGAEPLSFFDQSRTEIWWEDKVPKLFEAIPPHWMPTAACVES